MTDRPILFSAQRILALLDGRKTQTRRPAWRMNCTNRVAWSPTIWQKAQPGDRLWVRECFSFSTIGEDPWYWADGNPDNGDFCRPKPSIHMPRWASRLTLVVTDVRRQRLQDISDADVVAEGITAEEVIVDVRCYGGPPVEITATRYFYDGCDVEGFEFAVDAYAGLWDHLHGAGAWEANPEVVALSFQVEKINIDQLQDHTGAED
jgi:hypothetical protein